MMVIAPASVRALRARVMRMPGIFRPKSIRIVVRSRDLCVWRTLRIRSATEEGSPMFPLYSAGPADRPPAGVICRHVHTAYPVLLQASIGV